MFKITKFSQGRLDSESLNKEDLRLHKAEKGKYCVIGQEAVASSLEELLKTAAEFPCVFSELEGNKRAAANLIKTNIAVLDIDNEFTLDDAKTILSDNNISYGIYTSYSHQNDSKDKFHIIIPLSEYIYDIETYKNTYKAICSIFNYKTDAQTCSPANLFFNSNESTVETYFEDLRPFPVQHVAAEPVLNNIESSTPTRQLTRRTLTFLIDGARSGEWHTEYNLACKNLKSAGFSQEEAKEKLKRITGKLTDQDLYQLRYAYTNSTFEHGILPIVENAHPLRELFKDPKGKQITIPTRTIVETWVKEQKIVLLMNEQILFNNKYYPLDYIVEEIRNFSESRLKQQISTQHIYSVIGQLFYDNRDTRLKQMRDWMEYDSKIESKISNLVEAISIDEDLSLIETILKHFMWQVKRKLYGKPITYHMMPVFVGNSGSGKSEFIKKLIEPLNEVVYADGDFKKLIDSREVFNLTRNYIYFMDEMAKADMADVETIKNKITSSVIQYRRLGTNTTITGQNNVTFIGASNTDLEFIIKDPTSARRFFQINAPDKMDWKVINNFDYLALWRSVDENQESPYIEEKLEEVAEAQKDIKYKPPIEQFIEEIRLAAKFYDNSTLLSRKELFKLYQYWSVDNGYKYNLGYYQFCNFITTAVGNSKRMRQDGTNLTPRSYYILKEYSTPLLKIIN